MPLAPDSVAVALGAIDDARRLAAFAGVSAVLVPAAAIVLLARWRPPVAWGRGARAAARAAGTFAAVLYGVLAFEYARGDDRGAPARARLARALGAPVVDAMERYRLDRLVYPESLPALVPRYLAPADFRAPERSVLGTSFALEGWRDGYVLSLRWTDRARRPAACDYSSRERRWRCSGG